MSQKQVRICGERALKREAKPPSDHALFVWKHCEGADARTSAIVDELARHLFRAALLELQSADALMGASFALPVAARHDVGPVPR